jgi:hypothetical protein
MHEERGLHVDLLERLSQLDNQTSHLSNGKDTSTSSYRSPENTPSVESTINDSTSAGEAGEVSSHPVANSHNTGNQPSICAESRDTQVEPATCVSVPLDSEIQSLGDPDSQSSNLDTQSSNLDNPDMAAKADGKGEEEQSKDAVVDSSQPSGALGAKERLASASQSRHGIKKQNEARKESRGRTDASRTVHALVRADRLASGSQASTSQSSGSTNLVSKSSKAPGWLRKAEDAKPLSAVGETCNTYPCSISVQATSNYGLSCLAVLLVLLHHYDYSLYTHSISLSIQLAHQQRRICCII